MHNLFHTFSIRSNLMWSSPPYCNTVERRHYNKARILEQIKLQRVFNLKVPIKLEQINFFLGCVSYLVPLTQSSACMARVPRSRLMYVQETTSTCGCRRRVSLQDYLKFKNIQYFLGSDTSGSRLSFFA